MKENNSTIDKKNDKHGNKVSMHENVKKVDKEAITNENLTLFTRDHSTSLQSNNIKDIYEIKVH